MIPRAAAVGRPRVTGFGLLLAARSGGADLDVGRDHAALRLAILDHYLITDVQVTSQVIS